MEEKSPAQAHSQELNLLDMKVSEPPFRNIETLLESTIGTWTSSNKTKNQTKSQIKLGLETFFFNMNCSITEI